jgi:hypothetical protein
MQAAMQYVMKEDRLHVWLLVSNISLPAPEQQDCWQQRSINYVTQLYSEEVSSSGTEGPRLLQQAMRPGAAWTAAAPRKLQASNFDTSNVTAPAAPPLAPRRILHALSFNFTRDAFVLPAAAADQFFHIQNATLSQLPQGPNTRAAADMHAGPVPADVWTVMLWSVKRWELLFDWHLRVRACYFVATGTMWQQAHCDLLRSMISPVCRHEKCATGTTVGIII